MKSNLSPFGKSAGRGPKTSPLTPCAHLQELDRLGVGFKRQDSLLRQFQDPEPIGQPVAANGIQEGTDVGDQVISSMKCDDHTPSGGSKPKCLNN